MKTKRNIYTSSFQYKFQKLCNKTMDILKKNDNSIKSKLDAEANLAKKLAVSPSTLRDLIYGKKIPSTYDYQKLIEKFSELYTEKPFSKYCYEEEDFLELLMDDSINGDGMIKRIILKFATYSESIRINLISFLKYYLLVEDMAWTLVINYAMLNNEGRKKFKEKLFDTDIKLSYINNISKDIIELLELSRNLENMEFKILPENEQSKLLENTLIEKYNSSLEERFYRQMDFIHGMDSEDWKIITAFYLLSDDCSTISPYLLSVKQKEIISFSESLLRNKLYCDDYENVILFFGK